MDCINSECKNKTIKAQSIYKAAEKNPLEVGFACCKKCNFSKNSMDYRRRNLIKVYGVDNLFKADKIREKIKKTNLDRYGVENPFGNKEIIAKKEIKRQNTCMEKYGTKTALSNKDVQEKIKKTNMEKYGFSRAICLEEYKQKMYSTNIEKYGSKIPSKSLFLRERDGKEWEERRLITNKRAFYNKLLFSDRLFEVEPAFTFNEYSNHLSTLKWKCLKCNEEFEGKIQYGWNPRCKKCYPVKFGKKEEEISELLKSMNLDFTEKDRNNIKPFELDFFITSHNLAIEFNGVYWHSSLFKDKWYHQMKVELCNRKNIRLLHIYEWEWIINKEACLLNIKKHIENLNLKIEVRKPVARFFKNKTLLEKFTEDCLIIWT